jgi:oligosaccharide repeat unit polymerase
MGHQMFTIAYTIDLVPRTRAYEMGASYYYGLLTVFPNLFWKVHPTIVRGLEERWLIENVVPSSTPRIETYTFSFIAEAYLNFGRWGAPIFLGLLGFLFGSLVLWADRSGDIARLAMVAVFLVYFIFLPKAETALVARGLAWYSVLPYLAVRFLDYARSRHQQAISNVPIGPFRTEG